MINFKGLMLFEEFIDSQRMKQFDKKVGFIRLSHDINNLDGGTEGRQKLMNEAALKKLFIPYATEDVDTKKYEVPDNIPLLYYGGWSSEKSLKFLKKYNIQEKNLYNNPECSKISGSKVKCAQIFKNKEWLPKTVFNKKDALDGKVGFPVIAKISDGHSGLGIQKFDTKEELKKAPDKFKVEGEEKSFDLFCEFIDFKREYRCIFLKTKCIIINERVSLESTNKTILTKKKNEKIDFVYVEQDLDKVPKEFMYKINEIAKEVYNKTEFPGLWSLDIVVDKDEKIKLLEINVATGLGGTKMALVYKAIYEDYYKKQLPAWYWKYLYETFVVPGYTQWWPKNKKEIEKRTGEG